MFSESSILNKLPQDPDTFFQKGFDFFGDLFNPTSQYAYFWSTVKLILLILAIFFIFIIAYCVIRLLEIRKKEHEHVHHEIEEYAHKHKEIEENKDNHVHPRWKNVEHHLVDGGEQGWRLAILEADLMLEDLLDQVGFKGETLGDKLKAIDFEKYPGLRTAWEAHNVRNKIAHEGSDFHIEEHEVKRILGIYERIFRDFSFI